MPQNDEQNEQEKQEGKEEFIIQNSEWYFEDIQPQINEAQKELRENPKSIEGIITARRESNVAVADRAKKLYSARTSELTNYKQYFEQNKQFGNYSEEIKVIDQIIAQQETINIDIDTTKNNINFYVSSGLDKTLDQGKKKNALMQNVTPINEATIAIAEYGEMLNYHVPSLKQLKAELDHTKQAAKIWKGLSKIQGDDDRSKGYALLSDNIASMAMNEVNISLQGIAMVRALLTYAVADVLYHSLIKETALGLVSGGIRGYSNTNKGIKSAANAMYVLIFSTERKLDNATQKILSSYYNKNEKLTDGTTKERAQELVNKLEENKAIWSQQGNQEQIGYIEKDIKILGSLIDKMPKYDVNQEEVKSKLPTTAAAVVAGVVGAIVVGVVNAAYQGITKTTRAVVSPNAPRMSKGRDGKTLKARYAGFTPKEGTSWNKKRPQVLEERRKDQVAKSQKKYAKNTDRKTFTEIEKEREAKNKGQGQGFAKE